MDRLSDTAIAILNTLHTERLDCQSEYLPLIDAANLLAAYEDTGLMPEEVTTKPFGCVFYCNRRCNLDWDWCAEGPGCPKELDQKAAMHILELSQAEKDGRLVVLPSAPEINTFRAIVTAMNALDFYPAADPDAVFRYKQILCGFRDALTCCAGEVH